MQADSQGKINYDRTAPGTQLHQNLKTMLSFFEGDETLKKRLCLEGQCGLLFLDGMVNVEILNQHILQPLQEGPPQVSGEADLLSRLDACEMTVAQKYSQAVEALLRGDTVLMQNGSPKLYVLGTKGFPTRAVAEPDNEKALFGPREGFTESLVQNISMLRRKLCTSDLKLHFQTVSTRTNSRACVCYLDSLVNSGVLAVFQQRLSRLRADAFLDTYAINESIRDSGRSLLNTVGKTERPDTAARKLLDGGVVLLLDGSPVALLAPFLFMENFKSQDDNYIGYHYASVSRMLRYLAFFVTISIGALYISLVAFHSEMLPTAFMLTISAATSGLPMPTFMEFITMMLLFEMLRETGIRMSSKLGQSLSIVGALVIGQSAVEARFISAPMVIIVAISAITGLMIPSLSTVVILIRMYAVIAASLFGFYGYAFVMLGLVVHLFGLESFGIQYTAHMLSFSRRDLQNVYFRPPAPQIRWRTKFLARDPKRSS